MPNRYTGRSGSLLFARVKIACSLPVGCTGTQQDRTNKESGSMGTKLSDIIARGRCALCGKGVHIDNHEGRVACNGCNMATDNCTCPPER